MARVVYWFKGLTRTWEARSHPNSATEVCSETMGLSLHAASLSLISLDIFFCMVEQRISGKMVTLKAAFRYHWACLSLKYVKAPAQSLSNQCLQVYY